MSGRLWAAASAAAVLCCVGASPAAAAANRVWVSGHGADVSGCGAPTAPCRSLQYALSNVVVAGGEIDILDPAGYGAVVITKSVSIVNDGVGTAGVQATTGDAITVAAGPNDAVYLKGLNIDGVQGQGSNGVTFSSGAALTISGCTVRHFAENGVVLSMSAGASSLLVTGTTVSDNGVDGVSYVVTSGTDTLNAAFDHVTLSHNGHDGLVIRNTGPNGGVLRFVLSDVTATGNTTAGLHVQADVPTTTFVNVTTSTFSLNGTNSADPGIDVIAASLVRISRSAIVGNKTGVHVLSTSGGGAFTSGDNDISFNTADVAGVLQPAALQ